MTVVAGILLILLGAIASLFAGMQSQTDLHDGSREYGTVSTLVLTALALLFVGAWLFP